MELKYNWYELFQWNKLELQSHLYGIEIFFLCLDITQPALLQSHLYGIEIFRFKITLDIGG